MRQYVLLKVNRGGVNHLIINMLRPLTLIRKEAGYEKKYDGKEEEVVYQAVLPGW
jgi:hypothetical protein|nr:MAG TPA: hypothetical protein [Caudoviricetes sp.]